VRALVRPVAISVFGEIVSGIIRPVEQVAVEWLLDHRGLPVLASFGADHSTAIAPVDCAVAA
jgi:hypothetical protein